MIRDKILEIIVQIQNGDGAKIEELPEKGIERAFLEQCADQILSTLIEALPKEKIECVLTEGTRKYNIANDYPEDFCPPNERYVGFNEALNQIKKSYEEK